MLMCYAVSNIYLAKAKISGKIYDPGSIFHCSKCFFKTNNKLSSIKLYPNFFWSGTCKD